MDVKLYKVDSIYDHRPYPDGRWSRTRTEVDYTGRWKIVNDNGDKRLYLEVFTLEDKEYTDWVTYIVERSFLWWSWAEEQERPHKRTKVHAKVEWVDSYYLDLTYRDEAINECGGMYG